MTMKVFLVSVCFAAGLAAAVPCLAVDGAENPWNGTWKLNQERSKLTGDTFSIGKVKGGKLHYNNGAVSYDFACDGTDYATIGDRTISCTQNSESSYSMVTKAKGTEQSKAQRELSADGKKLTSVTKGTQPDGTPYTETNVFERLSGKSGLIGTWKNVKSESSSPDVLVISVSEPNAIHLELPGFKESLDGKMDGQPIPVTGPQVPEGLTFSFRKIGATRLTYAVKFKDKTLNEGEQVLSADGRTLTDESWIPAKPTEREIAFYEKQ
jgi:hypothetical protein